MDPLSIGFGVAGLVPLVASAIKLTRNYWAGVRGAKEKVATLITELEALQSNLHDLQILLDSNGTESESSACDQTSVLLSCSTACRVKLDALVQKLDRPGLAKGKMGALKWPFEEKEHKETITELRSLTAWMQFSLSIGGYRLLSSSSAEVLETLRKQLSHFEEIKEHQIGLRRDLENQRSLSQDLKREKQDLLNWLSVLNVQAQHDKIHAARTQHTGSWFLQDETFLRWRGDRADSHLLWCHGLPGSGKTVLASLAVDELVKQSPNSCPVAFFYFNYREAHQQDPTTVLSSLLRQVADTLDEIPQELTQMKLSKGDSGYMNLEDCKEMMAICLAETERTYLILDGLDECDLSKHRKTLLDVLHDLAQLPQTRLLVTSRPHIQDIARSFRDSPQLTIVAHDEDLEEYMSEELCTSHGSDDLDEELTTRIRAQITKRANGMFLLAVLQLRAILNEPTPGEMEDALDSMSRDLMGAFEETIARIKSLPKNRAQLGMDVLMWLCHARRVLSTAELSDALAFRKGRGSKLAKYRPSLNMILECCHGLVIPSANTGFLELAHYSIQEYLEIHSPDLFPSFEQQLASTCLGYLMLEEFRRGPEAIDISNQLIRERLRELPFASYAAQFWDQHTKAVQAAKETKPILIDFVFNTGAIASSVQIGRFERGFRSIYVDPRECLSRTPMHNASEYGLETLLTMILGVSDVPSTINSRTEIVGSTPIILAASSGNVSIVRLLLQHGADPSIANWYGNALHCAAEADQPGTIYELVGFGMDPNDFDEKKGRGSCKPPILCALDRDGTSSLKALLNLGASITMAESWCQRPFLHQATVARAPKVVQYLVQNGLADVNCKSRLGRTALDCAISVRSTETIRTLMSVGADPRQISPRSMARLAEFGLALGTSDLISKI